VTDARLPVHRSAAEGPRERAINGSTVDGMDTDASSPTENGAPRRGRPVARVIVASPELVEMDEMAFEAAVEAMANVLRLDWNLDCVLNEHPQA
jgi:hypothetical protein